MIPSFIEANQSVGSIDSYLDSVSSGSFFFGGFWLVLVQFHEFGKIELRFLEDLGLSNHAVVLEWEDFAALVLDLFANFFFKAVLKVNY
jgi:hypothetical protein